LKIESMIDAEGERAIGQVLTANATLFAWMVVDITRANPRIVSHRLSIFKRAKLISQKKRKLGKDRRQVAKV